MDMKASKLECKKLKADMKLYDISMQQVADAIYTTRANAYQHFQNGTFSLAQYLAIKKLIERKRKEYADIYGTD